MDMNIAIEEWAVKNDWKAIQVYGTPSGLFPAHWLDSCMPAAGFWKKVWV